MRLQVLSIYDSKLGEFSGLYLVKTLEVGVRMFGDSINLEDSAIAAHPEDYSLQKVGEFDTVLGDLQALQPSIVIRADEVVRRTAPREQQDDMFARELV